MNMTLWIGWISVFVLTFFGYVSHYSANQAQALTTFTLAVMFAIFFMFFASLVSSDEESGSGLKSLFSKKEETKNVAGKAENEDLE